LLVFSQLPNPKELDLWQMTARNGLLHKISTHSPLRTTPLSELKKFIQALSRLLCACWSANASISFRSSTSAFIPVAAMERLFIIFTMLRRFVSNLQTSDYIKIVAYLFVGVKNCKQFLPEAKSRGLYQ
jgi:hypothetical protein